MYTSKVLYEIKSPWFDHVPWLGEPYFLGDLGIPHPLLGIMSANYNRNYNNDNDDADE